MKEERHFSRSDDSSSDMSVRACARWNIERSCTYLQANGNTREKILFHSILMRITSKGLVDSLASHQTSTEDEFIDICQNQNDERSFFSLALALALAQLRWRLQIAIHSGVYSMTRRRASLNRDLEQENLAQRRVERRWETLINYWSST